MYRNVYMAHELTFSAASRAVRPAHPFTWSEERIVTVLGGGHQRRGPLRRDTISSDLSLAVEEGQLVEIVIDL